MVFLFAISSIMISTQYAFAETNFVSTVSGSAIPGCEDNLSCYSPYQTRISVGDSIIWTNDDTAAHTVTSGTPSSGASGIFDSSLFMSGASFEVEFFESGTYDYFCMVHPWMVGTVLVTSSPSASSESTSSGITPRGTPIPLDSRPKDVGGYTNYYNEKWDFSMDVPNEWLIDDTKMVDEGWEQIVFLTPDPDYFSTYVSIEYFFDDYTYDGLYGNAALRELETNLRFWCNDVTIDYDGYTCNNFEIVQTDIEDELYIISYTFTERGEDGSVFEKMAVLSMYPLSNSEYISIDVEIDSDNLEFYSQQIGYMLSSSDFSSFLTTDTALPHRNDIPVDLNFRNYHNDKFGFSIDYPSNWNVDDELLIDGDTSYIVSFFIDDEYLQTIDVSIQHGDFDFRGLSPSQYVSALEDLEKDFCTSSSYNFEGYRCSNFEVSDNLSGSNIDSSGNTWHSLFFTYTEDYPDQSYDVAAARYELPVGDDTFIVYFYFDLDSYADYLRDVPATQLVGDVMSSFELTSSIPTPTPTPQLECGPGTAPKNGQCVRIEMDNGGCLIATATYGSELSPQVQLLREIRDNSLLNTKSGTQFMKHFNDFYYSFSPVIADYERENPVFKEMVKVTITPMITSLSLMEYADSESSVLSIGVSLIVLNGMMYVGIPIAGIIVIRKRF